MKHMSEALETYDPAQLDHVRRRAIENARLSLAKYLPRAVEVLTELLEGAENERVRLSAAEAILDRAGLGKTQTTEVKVDQQEHQVARTEAEEIVARIQENQRRAAEKTAISLEALIVHEGEVEELPVAGPHTGPVIEAQAT